MSLNLARARITHSQYRDFDNFEQIHAANIENCWESMRPAPEKTDKL